MKPCDLTSMEKTQYEDPFFTVDYHNVGRGLIKKNKDEPHIVGTSFISIWRIVSDELLPVEIQGVFFNSETYLVHWTFECILEKNETREKTIFFYWKGSKATKGSSPLPPNFENETSIVNRLVQWSEPPVFFHIFSKPVIVFDGIYSKFNPNVHHLFIVRGELPEELHLYELPFLKKNLRSRGAFLIVIPTNKSIFLWKGSKITNEFDVLIKETNLAGVLKNYHESWNNFKILEMSENEENYLFEGDSTSYYHVKENCNFSPKLFYMNAITGDFLATEVEYPLRSKNQVAAFPFLQSHLVISDDQPGLFLLDNNHEIWLISNKLKPTTDLEEIKRLAAETAENYSKEKQDRLKFPVPVKSVTAGEEPIEFINIFPYWN